MRVRSHGILAAGGLLLLAVLAVDAIARVERTGAVPGDEFYAAGILYRVLPVAGRVVNLLLLALCIERAVALLRRRWRGERGGAVPAVLVAVAACSVLPAVPAPFALALLPVLGAARARAEVVLPVGAPSPVWIGGTLLAITAALLLVTGLESVVYTGRLAPSLFSQSTLWRYRVALPPRALAAAWVMLAAYSLVPLLVRAARTPGRRARFATVGLAAAHVVALALALWATVGDELRQTGIAPHVAGALVVLGTWMEASIADVLRFSDRASGPGPGWSMLAVAPLGPSAFLPSAVVAWLHRRVRAWWLLHSVAVLTWLAVLLVFAYPDLEDFRSRFLTVTVLAATHVFVLVLLSGAGVLRTRNRVSRAPRRTAVGAALLVLSLLVASSSALRPRSDVALVLAEYARFGYVVDRLAVAPSLRRWFEREPTEGASPRDPAAVARAPFRFHDESADRYPPDPPSFGERRPPIVMVLWDAARPDHTSVYGYTRRTTPRLEELAADGVVFTAARSQATATTCSVRHLFTGRYSSRFMLGTDHAPFFVHALREVGYRNFYLTALGSDYNGVSMASFQRNGPPAESDGSNFVDLGRHPKGIAVEAPDWHKQQAVLRAWREAFAVAGPHALDRSFTFLHLTGTHSPWGLEGDKDVFGSTPEDRYDGEMLEVDRLTGELLDELRTQGAYDDALVIVLADHGTGLLDHGRYAGFLPYEEQLRVPLVWKVPGIAPGRRDQPVGLIDVAPTLLGLFRPGERNPYDGVALWTVFSDPHALLPRHHLFALCAFEDAYALWEDGSVKLHHHRAEDYSIAYDLLADPGERRPLDESDPVVSRLEAVMQEFLEAGQGSYAHPFHYR